MQNKCSKNACAADLSPWPNRMTTCKIEMAVRTIGLVSDRNTKQAGRMCSATLTLISAARHAVVAFLVCFWITPGCSQGFPPSQLRVKPQEVSGIKLGQQCALLSVLSFALVVTMCNSLLSLAFQVPYNIIQLDMAVTCCRGTNSCLELRMLVVLPV